MTEIESFDVVIVGAGITGATLASILTSQGMSVALVEAQPPTAPTGPPLPEVSQFDQRVSSLTPRSQLLLERLGVWPAIIGYRHCPYRRMVVWDAEGTAEIVFDCEEVGVQALGYIVENRAITAALQQQLEAESQLHSFRPAVLETIRRTATSRVQLALEGGALIETELLVAADGARSSVREMLDFPTREWDYGHRAIATTVQVAQSHADTAWQCFMPSGPLAFLPLPPGEGHHFCSIVWSLEETLAESMMALDDAAFCEALQRAFESRLGAVIACGERAAIPLRQRHAVDYVQPGIALVGDAAHSIHPLAGQGINLGLQDVAVLAEEIVAAKNRGISPGELAVLARYQRRRKGDNLLMMAAVDGFKRLYEQRSPGLRWLRNAGMRGFASAAPVKRHVMRVAMGID